ncbi:MAG TPA: dihydrofolate reductase [Myxococcota bacterium]|nr:dihydrofolate reductase [Myxococcota bacterium]
MLALVAAVAENRVIGRAGALPWRLPDELAHFKRVTLGKPVLMGRHTFVSIGRPLPGRRNVVLSCEPSFAPAGVEVARDLGAALALLTGAAEICAIGGAAVYREALPRAQRIHLTRVHARPEGDAFFPELDLAEWRETLVAEHAADERHAHAFSIFVLERR